MWRAIVSLVFVLSGCASPERAAEQNRIERCKMTLPILHSEPSRPYRVVYMVEASSETDLAWYACTEHADAVISEFAQDQTTRVFFGGGPYFVGGKVKTKTESKFVGRAIKYDRVPFSAPPVELPSVGREDSEE